MFKVNYLTTNNDGTNNTTNILIFLSAEPVRHILICARQQTSHLTDADHVTPVNSLGPRRLPSRHATHTYKHQQQCGCTWGMRRRAVQIWALDVWRRLQERLGPLILLAPLRLLLWSPSLSWGGKTSQRKKNNINLIVCVGFVGAKRRICCCDDRHLLAGKRKQKLD